MMFDALTVLPSDPILGLMKLYRADPNPHKVDLGVGVYKNNEGQTPVMQAVTAAERNLLAKQTTKTYLTPLGNPAFVEHMQQLIFGSSLMALEGRIAAVQTPGGCGALRIAAELIKHANPKASIWLSNPTWANHKPLLGDAGVPIKHYSYLSASQTTLDWPAMQAALESIPAGDVVLLHACCHNPTGVDLTFEQWQWVAQTAQAKGFIPFIDMAYQGFGDSLAADAAGLRHIFAAVPEALLAVSCSKNFGLYRERVGLVATLCATAQQAQAAQSHFEGIVRGIYSMPPNHGAAIVAEILQDTSLTQQWETELTQMQQRIQNLRNDFVRNMNALGVQGFDFVNQQKGMFSYLGIHAEQVAWLAQHKSIYLLSNSRASIAGLNQDNVSYVCEALAVSLNQA
ncbi:amino acid aminotransferase [Marinagarivorans algicola]|uniref:amino acid aminotransferase n=1 Tax=Marinagarivorans algicola TaxID=1513270 RepID=UPI003140034F